MRTVAPGAVALLFGLGAILISSESHQVAAHGFAASIPQSGPQWESPLLRQELLQAADPPVLLRIRPPESPPHVGDPVAVDLLLENVDPLFGVDLTVTYPDALLSVDELLPGPLFPDGLRYVMKLDPPDAPGRVRYISTLLGDATPAASTGVVATLRFRAKAAGRAELGWDEGAIKLCDRESSPLEWTVEDAGVEVVGPSPTPTVLWTDTPTPDPTSAEENDPTPTRTPKPTRTATPTRLPTATRTPKPTAPPTAAPEPDAPPTATRTPKPTATPRATRTPRPTRTPVAEDFLSPVPEGTLEMEPANPLFPEPTLGPTVPIFLPAELPQGMPPVTEEGVVAILGPDPGVGILTVVFGDSLAEIRVDDQGGSMAVRVQPYAEPPSGVALPPDVTAARVFSLDLYSFEADSNSARRILYGEGRGSAPILLKWRLGREDYSRTLDEDGHPHPGRFVFYRISPEGHLVKIQTAWTPEPSPYGTLTALFVDRSTFLLALLPPDQEGRTIPEDPRYFRETGFRVGRDAFWDYFQKRGGLNSFGYPISREFLLEGFPVQLFQRALLQAMPDGGVATMNLLDSGLMPYTQINFSTFPAPDPALIAAAPPASDPGYAEEAIAFVRANVPDRWEGLPVDFQRGFFSRVRLEDAFPDGWGEPALVPLLNLELWGLPTSRPAFDPNNHGFVYQRFQRGILHYDAATGATQGLLLGDYLKALMTGKRLPPDLDLQARGSPFYRLYDRTALDPVAREWAPEGTSLMGAFEMDVPQEIVELAVPGESGDR